MAQQKIYLTKEGYEEQLRKYEELKEAEKKNIIALQEARAQGDLSENADYDAARNNQAIIAAALAETENILKNYVLITGNENSNLGKFITVKFLDEEGALGKVILHAKVGDTVLVNTEDGEKFEVKIINIAEEIGKKTKKTSKK